MNLLLCVMVTGIGATALTDVWTVARRSLLNVPAPDYGLVGRWLAWSARGRFRHSPISASPSVPLERLVGWSAHYVIGICFAALLLAVCGSEWFRNPALLPALLTGVCTVAAPFLLMQPGMGAGIAASRTRNPGIARLHSLITHCIFGMGLYVAGLVASYLFVWSA